MSLDGSASGAPPPADKPRQPAAAPPIEAMLSKLAAYVQGEAELSLEDYRLLEGMNVAAAERYSGMAEYATGLVALAERLQTKAEALEPQLSEIDALEGSVAELEGAVQQLDNYSRRLEARFGELSR